MREKLIELINPILRSLPWGEITAHTAEDIADRLIDNGVTLDNQVASSSKQVASSKWIPVKDRLPQGGEWVLTYYADKRHRVTKYDYNDGFPMVLTTGLEWVEVTHWMNLPQPPKGE